MSTAAQVTALVGRDAERTRLAGLVTAARRGTSGTLVVTGPAGIGKTSLLRAALTDPPGFATMAVEGVETEAGLAYSALHRLLAPFVPPEQPLPAPQQNAIDIVFGLRAGMAPDPFLVGLAALTNPLAFAAAAAARHAAWADHLGRETPRYGDSLASWSRSHFLVPRPTGDR